MGFVRQVGIGLYKNLLFKQAFIVIFIIYEVAYPLIFLWYFYYRGSSGKFSTKNVIDGLGVNSISSNVDVCNNHLPSPKPFSTVPSESNTTILGFTPKTALTKRLMSRFDEKAASIPTYWDLTVGFPNMTSLLDFYRTGNLTIWAAVEFQGLETATQLPLTAHYHIRHSESLSTESTFPSELLQPVEGSELNESRGNIQYLMSKAFIEEWGGNSSSFSLGLVQLVPRIRRVDPYFMGKLRQAFPAGIIAYLAVTVGLSVMLIVYEKRTKLREQMELMGLSSEALWVSWFVAIYVNVVILLTILAVAFSVASNWPGKSLLHDLSMSLFWVFLVLYSAALVSFWLMMAVVMRTSDATDVPVLVFWFAMVYTQTVVWSWYPGMSRWQKVANCLVFSHALVFGVQIIWEYDTANVPLTWSKLNEPLDYVDTLSMLDVWLMLLVDTGIHLLVTCYLDNVAPGHFGLPKPFYFFLTRAYWCGHAADSSGARHPGLEDVDRENFESDPVGLAVGVNIVHLSKEFGLQVAVRDVSLKMYEGQITVLLGPSGAGKTSIISMLTGVLPPTAGTAYIHGMDVRTDMAAIGQSLGVCPQHETLMRPLTVADNLRFFARLKGCPGARVKAEVDAMLEEVGLTSKRGGRAGQLSRAHERMLSVAIALVHGSKVVVILDEPSAGMDPQARRSLWQLLQRQRTGRTILLTTRDMDEAEMLGDRIAIMADGVVKCCGTSLFLKRRYGAGYHLVLVKAKGCNVPALTTEIRNRVPSATLDSDVGRELTFLLPDNQSAQFPDLFAFLEETKGPLGITDFGASATTLEEVFLKVGESSETGDLKPFSPTRLAVPEEGEREEASSVTPAAVDESSVDPSARQAASRVSKPEEQSSHGDNKLGSDVDNVEISDVNQNSGDVNQEASGVILTTSDVRMKASDVNQISGDVNQNSGDVNQEASGVILTTSDVRIKASDINQNSGDVNQVASGAILTTSDVRMKTSDVKQKASNVNQNAKAVDVFAVSRGYSRLSGLQLSLSQLRGMLVKKAICWRRSPVLSLIQLVLPAVFAVLAYPMVWQTLPWVMRRQGSKDEHPPLSLNLDPFCETTVLYGVFDSLGPDPNVTQPEVKAKASTRSSLGKLYAGQFGDNQHKAKEVGSYKDMCKLTTGFSVLDFSRRVIVGAAFGPWGNESEVLAMALYNPFPLHAMDIATALVLNAVAKERVNSSVNILPVLHPLPDKSPVTPSPTPKHKIVMKVVAGALVGLGMSFHAPLFVSSIISERVTGFKHVQRVSGVSPVVFWTGNLLWDLGVCAPTFGLVIGVLCLTDLTPLSGGLPPALIIVLFVLYGPAMLAFNYLTHFCFTTVRNAITVLFFLYLASGVVLPLLVFAWSKGVEGSQGEVYFLDAVCSFLLPAYNLIAALIWLFSNYENLSLCESADYKRTCLARESPCCKDYGKGCGPKPCLEFTENYWALEGGVGKYLLYLLVQSVVFLLLTLEIERRWLAWGGFSWPWSKQIAAKGVGSEGDGVERDADLAEERRRIERCDVIKLKQDRVLCKHDRVLLKDVSKAYVRVTKGENGTDESTTTLRAVERLFVGVDEKECLGLLGQSGAGKSTTLKMLTGEVVMTKGQAFVNGYSVMSQLRQVQRSIGYCPQTDPLIEHMTCNETLAMFGRLRGIPESHLNDCVASVLDVLELGSYGAKRAGNLSGGMKRKLTTAMSLIGDPPVILLDEPSTGLDPSARRHLWDVLSSVRSWGSTLILASNSMEECEALCTRVAIMVNGRMKCLGTTQHLQSRFGQGLTLSVKMGLKENGRLASFNPLVTHVQTHFRSAKCFTSDHWQGYAYIQIPDPHTPLSAVFRALESAKLALNVQDYSVHQTSLQQVFRAFTSDQQRYQQLEQEP